LEIYLTLLNNKFLKVDYPNPNSLHIYQRIKALGEKLTRNSKLWPFTRRIISVTKPSGGISMVDNPKSEISMPLEDRLTILTANLCHDWPRKRGLKGRLECFAELVDKQDADILLLQEIARTKEIYADEWLGEKLGMAYVYSRANGHAKNIGFEEGLGVFSRFPIAEPRLAQLSDHMSPFHRRIALGASIKTNIGEIVAFSVHLAINSRKNRSQVSRLKDWVDEQSGVVPAVIGGDFNAEEHSSQIQSAQSSWCDSYRVINPGDAGYTHQLHWPWGEVLRQSRLDYLFLRRGESQWSVDEARPLEMDYCSISDHRPVLTKIRKINNEINTGSNISH
jgi:endonuclease/exonuclease/phosphatase family metal-dependent hydrolase